MISAYRRPTTVSGSAISATKETGGSAIVASTKADAALILYYRSGALPVALRRLRRAHRQTWPPIYQAPS